MSRAARAGRGNQRPAVPKTAGERFESLAQVLSELDLGQSLKQISNDLIEHDSELGTSDLEVVRGAVAASSEALSSLCACLVACAETPTETERVWEILAEQGISYRPFLLWLHSLNEAHDQASFSSACIYTSLLRLPGNVNIFNPMVLRSSLSLLKLWARANQVQAKPKGKGEKKSQEDDEEDGAELFEDDEAEEQNDWLTQTSIQAQILKLITLADGVLATVSLENHVEMMTYVGEALIEVTRATPGSQLAKEAYKTMHHLVVPLHGNIAASFNLLLKSMLPSVLMTFTKLTPATVPKNSQQVRQESVDFITAVATGSRFLWWPILNFLQHLCVRTPEKAEYKRATAKSIVDLCSAIPNVVARFSEFLSHLSRNAKPAFRAVSVDVATEILRNPSLVTHESFELPDAPPEEEKERPEGEGKQPHPRLLLKIFLDRCSDKTALVRAKALTSLATCLEQAIDDATLGVHFTNLLQTWANASLSLNSLTSPTNSEWMPATPSRTTTPSVSMTPRTRVTPVITPAFTPAFTPASTKTPASTTETPSTTTALNDAQNGFRKIATVLSLRSADARPVVRKAAIQALCAIFVVGRKPMWNAQDLQVFFDGCMDSSLSIRRAAMAALSELVTQFPQDSNLNTVWLGAVLPLCKDPELTVQEDALQHIDTLILQRVLTALKSSTDEFKDSIWTTLSGLDTEMIQFLHDAVTLMIRRKSFPKALVKPLNKAIAKATEKGVWMLAEIVSAQLPEQIDAESMIAAWNTCQSKTKQGSLFESILSCMGNIAQQLPTTECATMAMHLFNSLSNFREACSPTLAKTMIRTMHQVCGSLAHQQEKLPSKQRTPIPPWESELRSICHSGLEAFMFEANEAMPTDDAALIRYLFILGEICLGSTSEIPKLTTTLVQAMTAPSITPSLRTGKSPSSAPVPVHVDVRAHAFVALGKMCLKKESLAKQVMPSLVEELHDGKQAVIQNNILIVLCDLARTFTAVVDNYVSSITFCLRSSSEIVRKHTLMILAQLLQEDYLKWKASMFFRFLTAIVDDSLTIRKLGEQCFRTIFLLKAPNKFYLHFIETVFFLNKCTKHSLYNQFHVEQDAQFAVTSQRKRNLIYNFLLEFMSDVQKFQTAAKLCQDVLGAVADGSLLLDDSTVFDVVKDALLILSSKSMKIGKQHGAGGGGGEEPEGEEPAAEEGGEQKADDQKNAAIKGKFLSGLVKKNTLESVVPILIELKRLCERQQSPLLRYLMFYLKELMSDYKHELEDVLFFLFFHVSESVS